MLALHPHNRSDSHLEGLTDKTGMFGYQISEQVLHTIRAEKKGFLPYERDIILSQGNWVEKNTELVRIPLIPAIPEDQSNPERLIFILTSCSLRAPHTNDVEFKLICPKFEDGKIVDDVHLTGEGTHEDDHVAAVLELKDDYGFYGIVECKSHAFFRLTCKFNDPETV